MFNPFKARAAGAAQAPRATGTLRDTLVPRIKHMAFARELRDRGIPAEHLPLVEPLVGELLVTFAFDLPDQFVMANPTNLAGAGIAPAEARALACANLRARVATPRLERKRGVLWATTGDDWEACLLLLDELWSGPGARFEPGCIVCVPRRDCLLVSEGAGAEAVTALQAAAAARFAATGDVHALSLQLMSRQGGAWRLP